MRPTPDQLEGALRAASDALPPGEMLLHLMVVTTDDGQSATIDVASNIDSPLTRINILQARLEQEQEGVH